MINLLIRYYNTQGIVRLLGPSVSTVAYTNYTESKSNTSDLVLIYPVGTLLQDCARFLHQPWTALQPIPALILQESCKCKGYNHFLVRHLHLSCKLCKNLIKLACKIISLPCSISCEVARYK